MSGDRRMGATVAGHPKKQRALRPSDFARKGPVLDLLGPALHLGRGGRQAGARDHFRRAHPPRPDRGAFAPLSTHPAHGAQRVEHAEVILAGLCALPAAVHFLQAAVVVCGVGRGGAVGCRTAAPPSRTRPRPPHKVPPTRHGPAAPRVCLLHPRLRLPFFLTLRLNTPLQNRPRPLTSRLYPSRLGLTPNPGQARPFSPSLPHPYCLGPAHPS